MKKESFSFDVPKEAQINSKIVSLVEDNNNNHCCHK